MIDALAPMVNRTNNNKALENRAHLPNDSLPQQPSHRQPYDSLLELLQHRAHALLVHKSNQHLAGGFNVSLLNATENIVD